MKLYLGGYLNSFTDNNNSSFELVLEQPALLKEILHELGIPLNEVQIVLINEQLYSSVINSVITNDDHVKIFPQISGG